MNQQETAAVLAVISTYDRREFGHADVIAWHGAIGDLPFELVSAATVKHHATTTDLCKPAHLRILVRAAQTDAAMRALPAHPEGLVSMPDWFRSSVAEHRKRARALKDQQRQAGDPVTFGDAIVHAFDGRLR